MAVLDVVGVNGNLVLRPYKFNFGEGGAAGTVVRVVLHVGLGACQGWCEH
jgi:hypothetical protein